MTVFCFGLIVFWLSYKIAKAFQIFFAITLTCHGRFRMNGRIWLISRDLKKCQIIQFSWTAEISFCANLCLSVLICKDPIGMEARIPVLYRHPIFFKIYISKLCLRQLSSFTAQYSLRFLLSLLLMEFLFLLIDTANLNWLFCIISFWQGP